MSNAEVSRETIIGAIPNLDALHEDTKFHVYREFLPKTDEIEYTVFYREPGEKKMRVDGRVRAEDLARDKAVTHKNVRITYWGSASFPVGVNNPFVEKFEGEL